MAMRSRLLWLCTALVFELHALVVQHVPTARLPTLSTRRSLALPLATATDAGQATPRTAAVVGAGPAGALTAIMLAQRGWRVNLYDALLPPPPASDAAWGAGERSYQLGLNGRGQKALREFGCMERVDTFAASVNGRLSFAVDTSAGAPAFSETRFKPPGTPGAEKSYVTRVMQRDRLQAVLLEEAAERYGDAIRVTHGVACVGVRMEGARPALELRACEPVDEPRLGLGLGLGLGFGFGFGSG